MAGSKQLREFVAQRAGRRCEYCRYPDRVAMAAFELEHVFPETRGGELTEENTAWSCRGCNAHKQAAVEAEDPDTGVMAPLFHPRTQVWGEHFEWSVDKLRMEGKTATGRATIARLRTNRPGVVNLRAEHLASGQHPPAD